MKNACRCGKITVKNGEGLRIYAENVIKNHFKEKKLYKLSLISLTMHF